jgi:hypothetical protein
MFAVEASVKILVALTMVLLSGSGIAQQFFSNSAEARTVAAFRQETQLKPVSCGDQARGIQNACFSHARATSALRTEIDAFMTERAPDHPWIIAIAGWRLDRGVHCRDFLMHGSPLVVCVGAEFVIFLTLR